ncbi:LysR family transcriptional regulator [Cohnella cholangitidis]|uniref:LysR family transcriptional regulator n=1 Tax=Cohnella cholangitidis TaxID=2598458 RepID=A0A7G5BU79_9BACL|nr:LysR family transcriptional regulator [Cohnella cholangitidis]QMV40513.1 LysR family transcriptional regulator [Cohnella cholangitidis]
MNINTEWYRAFYWTAVKGSLSRAAEKLHITQPAVSHTLKQLESQLGGQLFFRTPKGVVLTKEGEVLFSHVKQAFQLMEIGEKKIAEMHNLDSGEIHIGASDTLCKHFLLPYLEQYHQAYPNVRIHVTNRTTPETLALLKNGLIDFGIVNLPAADGRVNFRESQALHECLIGGKAYAALAEQPFHLEELSRYPLLMLESGGNTRRFLDGYSSSHGVTLKPEFELGSIDLIIQFVRSGFGLAFVAREYAQNELDAGTLVEIPLIPAVPERHVGIATLSGTPLSSASRRLLELLP